MGLLAKLRAIGTTVAVAALATLAQPSSAHGQSQPYIVKKGDTPWSIAKQTLPLHASESTIAQRIADIQHTQPNIFGKDLGYVTSQGSFARKANVDGLGDEIAVSDQIDLTRYQTPQPQTAPPTPAIHTPRSAPEGLNSVPKVHPRQPSVVKRTLFQNWRNTAAKAGLALLTAATIATGAYAGSKLQEGLENYAAQRRARVEHQDETPAASITGEKLLAAGALRVEGTHHEWYRVLVKSAWYEKPTYRYFKVATPSTVCITPTGNKEDDRVHALEHACRHNTEIVSAGYTVRGLHATVRDHALQEIRQQYDYEIFEPKRVMAKVQSAVQDVINEQKTLLQKISAQQPYVFNHPWNLPA